MKRRDIALMWPTTDKIMAQSYFARPIANSIEKYYISQT